MQAFTVIIICPSFCFASNVRLTLSFLFKWFVRKERLCDWLAIAFKWPLSLQIKVVNFPVKPFGRGQVWRSTLFPLGRFARKV